MSLSNEDGLDWFKRAGIKLTPDQEEEQANAIREQQRREYMVDLNARMRPADVPLSASLPAPA